MKRLPEVIKVVLVNIVVIVLILGSIELFFRLRNSGEPAVTHAFWPDFRPYVMFTVKPRPDPVFVNEFTQEHIPSTIATNTLGFNDPHEFDYTKPYEKRPNEKVVLFTGASAGWGVGASATDKTIAGRMQYYLNNSQDKFSYTVINMSMGSYLAYQQFLTLSLWGESFRPDWIVSMDGYTDAEAGCGFSQGVGNPMFFAAAQAYIRAYLAATQHPSFYRGWLENQIVKYSAAYRALTGKDYVPYTLTLDQSSNEGTPARRAIIPTEVGAARDMLAFYLKGERAMLGLFPQARYILSTAPTVNDFRGDFADVYDTPVGSDTYLKAAAAIQATLDKYLNQYENEACGQARIQVSHTFIFVNGAIELEQLVDGEQKAGRRVQYFNIGALLPNDRTARMPFFIDGAHLSDKGMDVTGRFYAEKILAADGLRN